MKITLVKGIGFIINLVWTGWGRGPVTGALPVCCGLHTQGEPWGNREEGKGLGKVGNEFPLAVTQRPQQF